MVQSHNKRNFPLPNGVHGTCIYHRHFGNCQLGTKLCLYVKSSFKMSSRQLSCNCCIKLCNLLKEQKSLSQDGLSIVKNICEVKKLELANEEQDEKIFETLMSNLRNLTSKLLDIISELDDIVGKMNKITKKLKAIHDLSGVQSSECNDMDEDLVRLMSKFSEASQEIEQMYKADMKIKSGVAKEICILKFETQLTFFELCWEYEPKINKEKIFSLLAPIIFELKLQSTCLHLI
ncbi:hypothetical protein CDAR_446291 [Caerostris darwini]|uniref:Uncharacterized protein n=1 Tax=Caerostris darwini TaxID=1538125 RepID=A0AAV4S428_9ARAC|nr:hypothetical protein CDAR_446291 [Caerostris darwini]